MRAIARKEREVAKKLEAVRLETEARIAREAAVRDAERKKKVEEKLRKSQAILKEIERKGADAASSVILNLLGWRRWRRHDPRSVDASRDGVRATQVRSRASRPSRRRSAFKRSWRRGPASLRCLHAIFMNRLQE